jgi:alcohol dehydrogenase class IV
MSQEMKQRAGTLLDEFKGKDYVFGLECVDQLGRQAASLGKRASLVVSGVGRDWGPPIHEAAEKALAAAGVKLAGEKIPAAKPNSPREDVFRVAEVLREQGPDVIVSVGGGSNIDATKASNVWLTLSDIHADFDSYFGVGQVAQMLADSGRKLLPMVAVQLVSGSGAHLTKYSNITNLATNQKLLIIDPAVVPPRAVFDYELTATASPDLTMDGGLDGLTHSLEVWMGVGSDLAEKVRPVSLTSVELIVSSLKAAVRDGGDLAAREALGLGTDLGGYAIMIGGTNGAHLTSFSLVDLLPHGRACALMEPYYVVFFSPAIEDRLRPVAEIYRSAGYIRGDLDVLHGRDLGLALAEGMAEMSRDIGFPTTLGEVEGFTAEHTPRVLAAAKDPKLASKLQNMPVRLSAETVDEYMGPVLEAARTGDFAKIRNVG